MTLRFLSTSAAAPARSPLAPVLRRAGAVSMLEHGWEVAANFGSAAGEVSVCRRTVGLADRSHLGKLELQGDPAGVARLALDVAGAAPIPGAALRSGEAWWCSLTAQRMLVLCDPAVTAGLREQLHGAIAQEPLASVVDVTSGSAAIALAGPRARAVLQRVTALDTRPAALPEGGVRPGSVARVPALLLRCGPMHFLVLVGSAHAEYVWRALEDAGAPLGASCVGAEALERLAVADREAARQHA